MSFDEQTTARELLETTPVLVEKLHAAIAVDAAGAERALIEVLRFLMLSRDSPRPLTPSVAIDLAWHELILCTRPYAALCVRLGGFVHHDPGGHPGDHRAAFARTLALYRDRFGPPDSPLWGPAAACGACDARVATPEPEACTSKHH